MWQLLLSAAILSLPSQRTNIDFENRATGPSLTARAAAPILNDAELPSQSAEELRLSVPSGLSLLGNPFATNLLIRLLITNPPEGLEVYTFDAAEQQYRVTQFSFGNWTDSDHVLASNAGAYIRNPGAPFETSLAGPEIPQVPELRAGLNLISVPAPEVLEHAGRDGDVIYRRVGTQFESYTNRLGAWVPNVPPVKSGEGFFFHRNEPAPSCGGGTVLFNNYVPGLVNERILPYGCNVVSGPEWRAQLVLRMAGQADVPLGVPVQFLTGANSGYLDIFSGAIVCVPGFQPGGSAQMFMRFWKGDSFAEASWTETSPLFTVTLGGGLEPPAPLTGFTMIRPFVPEITPRGVFAFEGDSIELRLQNGWPLQFNWQKETTNGMWLDLPGQTNPIITLSRLGLSDAGNYRISWSNLCAHASSSATLIVRPLPSEKVPGAIDPSLQARFGGVQTYLVSDAKVYAVAVGPSNEIFVGGHFTQVNGKQWNGLARLHADGSLDESFRPPTFDPGPSPGSEGSHIDTHQIFIQTDGAVWAGFGGYGSRFRPSGAFWPYTISNYSNIRLIYPDGRTLVHAGLGPSLISRFLADAAPDPTFSAYTAQQQDPQLLLRNQKILILRSVVERRLPNGSLDAGFRPPPLAITECCGAAHAIERPNGQVYIAGPLRLEGSTNTPWIVRLNSDGSLDDSFSADPRIAGIVAQLTAVALQPNGKILLGGSISAIPGVSGRGLVRLNTDGSLDSTFQTGQGISDGHDEPWNSPKVLSLAVERDGNILVGGDFQKFDGVSRDGLVRLYGDPVLPTELTATVRDGTVELHVSGNEDLVAIEQNATLAPSEWREFGTVHLGKNGATNLNAATDHQHSFFRARALR